MVNGECDNQHKSIVRIS